jgi:hypothetical protein
MRVLLALGLTAILWVVAQAQFFTPTFLPATSSQSWAFMDHGGLVNISTGTLSLNPAATITAGSLVVVVVVEASATGGSIGTLADSAGNVYTKADDASPNAANANGRAGIWYRLALTTQLTTASTWTYTKIGTGATTMTAVSATYGGTASLDVHSTLTTGNSTSPQIGPDAPTGSDLCIAAVGIVPRTAGDTFNQDVAHGWSNGPDAINATTLAGSVGGNKITSAFVAYAPTITSRPWAEFQLCFKAA